MSDHTLNNIVCMALIDGKFRDNLLANPANVVGDFDLDAEEQDVLKAIKADSVTEYARKLYSWMLQRTGGNGNGNGNGNGHRKTYRSSQPMPRLHFDFEPVD